MTIPAGKAVLIVLDGMSGDANGDGVVDAKDLVRHKRVEAQEARLDFAQGYVADLNEDNVIDEIDIDWIRYYLAFEKFGGEVPMLFTKQ